MTRLVVLGGGISGLAAAWDGLQAFDVTLVEASRHLGGKIVTRSFAGIDLDTGPDAFLARVPFATTLAREAGLGDQLVSPGTGEAWMWARGRLRRLPSGLVLGVPTDVGALRRSGVVGAGASARAAADLLLPGPPVGADEDVTVGALVRRRMGRAVQMELVDPLVGGINAGHTDALSAAVAAPQLLAAGRRSSSLIRGLRGLASTPVPVDVGGGPGETGAAAPVFMTVQGGLQRLVDSLAVGIRAARGAEIITGDGAAALEQRPEGGWRVRLTSGRALEADAVVVAVPASTAAGLLAHVAPAAAETLRGLSVASVVLTTLAYRTTMRWEGSGFLVPRGERRLLSACSWVGTKWPHLDQEGVLVVRASSGRVDDDRALGMDDAELVRGIHGELDEAMLIGTPPVEAAVHRWPGAFPQYETGHLDRIASAEAGLPTGLALAGAALRGVGIATCVAGGRAAVARLRSTLGSTGPPRHGSS